MSYVPTSPEDKRAMLAAIGVAAFEDLIADVPERLRLRRPLAIPAARSEPAVFSYLRELAEKNKNCQQLSCFLGAGIYDHYVPAAVDAIISRSEFATSYTPYQAEVSQGTLQSIYEFQSLICRLTGMDVANASMYDGASAAAEAVLLALAHTGRKKVLLSAGLHPAYRHVITTYTSGSDLVIERMPEQAGRVDPTELGRRIDADTACVLVQSPNFLGLIEDVRRIGEIAQGRGALYVLVCNPFSLGVLVAPGEVGADLAVGELQVYGNALNFGGPLVGYFAAKRDYLRKLPGRLAARTKDVDGRTGYVLTLQTREQHIRRDKATSNICTNQALCALAATVHMTLLGRAGIRQMATLAARGAHHLAHRLAQLPGFSLPHAAKHFNEFVVSLPLPAAEFAERMAAEQVLAGLPLARFFPERTHDLLVAVTEKRTAEELEHYLEAAQRVAAAAAVRVS